MKCCIMEKTDSDCQFICQNVASKDYIFNKRVQRLFTKKKAGIEFLLRHNHDSLNMCSHHYYACVGKKKKKGYVKKKSAFHKQKNTVLYMRCTHKTMKTDCEVCVTKWIASTKWRKKYCDLAPGKRKKERLKVLEKLMNMMGMEWLDISENSDIVLNEWQCSNLILTGARMSQRNYNKNLKCMKGMNIILVPYKKCRAYISKLVEDIEFKSCIKEDCQCSFTSITSLIKLTYETPATYALIKKGEETLTQEKLSLLVSALKAQDFECYGSLDDNRETVLIRWSLDNFRSVGDTTIERASFFIMNMFEERESPLFEIPFALWKGDESHDTIKRHLGDTTGFPYSKDTTGLPCGDECLVELARACHEGITVDFGDGPKTMNVVVVMVPDLSCFNKFMGRAAGGICGGPFCEKPTKKYGREEDHNVFPLRTVKSMVSDGIAAEKKKEELIQLNRSKSTIQKIPQQHNGQRTWPLFSSFSIMCTPPDILHCVLGIHRILWFGLINFLYNQGKNIEWIGSTFCTALCSLGLNTLSLQIIKIIKKKKAGTEKKIKDKIQINGNDCKRLEMRFPLLLQSLFPDEGDHIARNQSKGTFNSICK